jgi:zinc protease
MFIKTLASRSLALGLALASPLIGALTAKVLAAEVPAAEVEPDADLAHPNPEAVSGQLPNGMRYTIQRHPSHNKESVLLRFEVGSREETDGLQGVAHFLEHMAFRGPRHFQTTDISATFAKAGIAFGRDQNAFTTYDTTTYVLNMSEVSDAKLDLGFRWLGDVAKDLEFDPTAVDAEKNVVFQEYIRGLGPARDAQLRAQAFLQPHLRSTTRQPIGLEATIKAADAKALRGFYQTWYRPENAIIVAVGDEPVEVIQKHLIATFGGWRVATPPTPRFDKGGVDLARPSDVLTITEPKLPTEVTVCRFGEKDPDRPEGVVSHRLTLAENVWTSSLALRLHALVQSKAPPIIGGSIDSRVFDKTVRRICLTAAPVNDDWKTALKTISDEIRREATYGATPQEFDDLRSQVVSSLDQGVATEATRDASSIASTILYNYEAHETYDNAAENRRIQLKALSQVDLKVANAAFHHRWDQASAPLFVIVTPKPVAASDVTAAWTADQAASTPSPPQPRVAAPWGYSSFGPPGKVASREALHDPDFTRLTFANGVIVNFKQTAFAKNRVDIRVRFGAGQKEISPGQVWNAQFGASLLTQAGLGKNTAQDMIEIAKGRQIGASLAVGRSAFDIGASTRTQDLQLQLQYLAALVADPGFRPTVDGVIPSSIHAAFRQINSNPVAVAGLALAKAMPQPHVADLPAESEAAALTEADFKRLLAGPLETDGLEISLVGDIDEASATQLLASTFGALKPRQRLDRKRADAVLTVYPSVPPPLIKAIHSGPKDKAAVIMVWPTTVATQAITHELRVDLLLASILQNKLIEQIRKTLGQTYTPNVNISFERGGDQNAISTTIETTPSQVVAVIDEIKQIAKDLAGDGIAADALEQVRKPLLDSDAQQRTYNGWWLSIMDGSFEHPEFLLNTRTQEHDFATIGLDEVKAEARRWLTQPPIVAISVPAEADGAAKPAPSTL